MANENWDHMFTSQLNSLHIPVTGEWAETTYEPATPTTHSMFSWSNPSGYQAATTTLSPGLSLQGHHSHSAYASTSVSQPQQQQQQYGVQRPFQTPQEISVAFNAALGLYQPGTPEYNHILAAYRKWYDEQCIPAAEDDDDDDNDDDDDGDSSDGQMTIQMPTGSGSGSRSRTIVAKDVGQGRVYRCPWSDCNAQPRRKADLARHVHSVHTKSAASLHQCHVEGCNRVGDRGFTRKDHLTEHLRNSHHLEEQYPKKHSGKHGEKKRRHGRSK